MTAASNRLPWREPVFWLVLALPLSTIVAGVVTMRYAIGSAEAIAEPVARVAQVQTADLDADAQADAMGLSAELVRDHGRVSVRLSQPMQVAPTLRFEHAAASVKDATVDLRPVGDAWSGEVALERAAYRVTLVAADGSWRLRGRIAPSDSGVALMPTVAQ